MKLFAKPELINMTDDAWKFTPLHLAANNGYVQIAQYLLTIGASFYRKCHVCICVCMHVYMYAINVYLCMCVLSSMNVWACYVYICVCDIIIYISYVYEYIYNRKGKQQRW